MANMTISDVLRGCVVGRIQTVGNMQVIPLTSELIDDRFASPKNAEIGTADYGTMVFKNMEEKPMIIPSHVGYVVKQAAQDHAMTHAGYVASAKTKEYHTAACIQQSQGGLIGKAIHKMLILPHALRELALKNRKTKSYDKLWPAIGDFNRTMGLSTQGHLEYFLKEFQKELDEFVAEFECVPNQIGAIILVNGGVIGVERTPNYEYWRDIWPCLIRECYGSVAIQAARAEGRKPPPNRVPIPTSVANLEELEEAFLNAEGEQETRTKDIVRKLVQDPFTVEHDETTDGLSFDTLTHKQFTGQTIKDGEKIVYASFTVTAGWAKDRNWLEAEAFTI